MARLVLTDASALIGLARVDGLPWLGALFGVVWMPPEVRREVLPDRGHADEGAIRAAQTAGWLRAVFLTQRATQRPRLVRLIATGRGTILTLLSVARAEAVRSERPGLSAPERNSRG